jgi:hypothetical protein
MIPLCGERTPSTGNKSPNALVIAVGCAELVADFHDL